MNKFFIYSMGIVCLALNFTSCDNDFATSDIQEAQLPPETKSLNLSTDTVYENNKFIYEGKTYDYVATIVNDSVLHISDQSVEELFQEFENYAELVTHMHRDGTIELFKDNETFHAQLPGIIERDKDLIGNRVQPYNADVPWETIPPIDNTDNKIANLYLCDDDGYRDTHYQLDLRSGESSQEISKLKSKGLNDKVTSFAAYTIAGTTLFELFEDSGFKDHCFSFVVYTGSATQILDGVIYKWAPPAPQIGQFLVADLKDLWVKGHSVDTWNDRISSVRITRQ